MQSSSERGVAHQLSADGQPLARVLVGSYTGRMGYERLIREAEVPQAWDFSLFRGRFVEAEPSWEFSKLMRSHMWRSSSMLEFVVWRHESYVRSEVRRVPVSAAREPS